METQDLTAFVVLGTLSYGIGHVIAYFSFDKNKVGYKKRYLILTSFLSFFIFLALTYLIYQSKKILFLCFIVGYLLVLFLSITTIFYLYSYSLTEYDTNYRFSKVCLIITLCFFAAIPVPYYVFGKREDTIDVIQATK